FGPTNPRRNGPFRPLDRVVYLAAECAPCYQRTCAAVRCLLDISPDEVARSVRELLDASE
ncbi:MAG TPA: lipopolysaccharide heptosyltransferase I, partial [Candidatus Aminicenantes bacterium]|nr:lipopolysaccharide heptosyltransferase I [Candidatus Aminicenantes bacterium]